jgi:hypothetical protein
MCQLSHFASRAYAKRKRIERRHFNAGQRAIELADQCSPDRRWPT